MKQYVLFGLLLIVSLLVIDSTLACQLSGTSTSNITVFDTIESSGRGASCNATLYNSTAQIINGTMIANGLLYSYTGNIVPNGLYTANIVCDLNGTVYGSTCNADIKPGSDDIMIIAAIILLPMLLSFLLMAWAWSLGEDHSTLRIGLLLLSFVPFWISLWFSTLSLVKFFSFPELIDAITDITYWTGWTWVFIVTYFCIYAIWKGIEHSAQEKQAKMEY